MTAAVRNALDVPIAADRSSKFFEALAAADRHIDAFERIDWAATFAPPVMMAGHCPCGAVFEVRHEPIQLTDDERAAVADALGGLDVGDIVAGAINAARERDHHDAYTEWYDAHADCGGDVL